MIRNIKKRIILKFFCKTNIQKVKYLKSKGMKIGENVRILSDVTAFGTEPFLISIGKNCLISSQVHFVNHDGGMSVLNNLNKYGRRMDKLGTISIGENCFIGMNTIIMPNVKIGNNCIVGAGAIVTKDIPDNMVACGIPAKIISTLDEYCEKNREKIYPTARMPFEEKRKYCEKNILLNGKIEEETRMV